MLNRVSMVLVVASGALFVLEGLPLFLAPGQMAPLFAWKVSPFVTMTIGAWCLGNGWLALISARRRAWRLVYSALLYLLFFGLIELGVAVSFREKLVLVGPVAWGYILALVASAVAGIACSVEFLLRRPDMGLGGPPIRGWQRVSAWAFVLFVGFLAAYGMLARPGALGTNGGIFPEVMSQFTLRSFAAFYLSLALAALPFLFERSLSPLLHHSFASYGLILTITAAAFVNWTAFDFGLRPGGLIYIGAYLVVGIPVGIALGRLGTGRTIHSERDKAPYPLKG